MRGISYPLLECKNRDSALGVHEIQIPFPKLFDRAPNPLATAKDIPAGNVACPHCKHVYEYTRDDVRWHLFQIPDRDPTPNEPTFFAVEFVCDDPDCKALVLKKTQLARGEVGIEERQPVPSFVAFSERFREEMKSKHQAKPKTVTYYENGLNRLLLYPALCK